MMTTNPTNYQSETPCKCGGKGVARKMGGNVCLKCRTVRGQGSLPLAAALAPETESLEDYLATVGATKVAMGVSGCEEGYLARENASERERETFGAYLAAGCRHAYLQDMDNY